MGDLVVAVIQGIVEGLTEFIPVSSTGHLIIVGHLLGLTGPKAAAFDIVIQLGAILSVVALYFHKFWGLLRPAPGVRFAGVNGLWLLFLTCLPAGLLGFFVHNYIEEYLFGPLTVALALAVGAVLILLVEKFKPMEQLCQFVTAQKGKSGIVYCNSRNKVERIAEALKKRGISAAGYHAGMENEQREQVQRAFQRDNVQVVVATIAFGMGINKSNVRFVAHFDLSRSIEAYYQETGRAGRDDLPAEAVLFYEPADYAWLYKILQEKPETPQRQIEQHKLEAIGEFAESQTCRRLVLLNYFGENRQNPCTFQSYYGA